MKSRIIILVLLVVAYSCSTTKKVNKIDTAVNKKDTSVTVIVKEVPKVDSVAIIKSIVNNLQLQQIDFKTFYAKLKVDYESAAETQNFIAYMYVDKDKSIVLRLVGSFLGITKEGFVAKITKDSVIVLNKIKKTVQYRTLSYLKDLTQLSFDYNTLQNLLIGNPVFLDSNIVSYRSTEEQLSILMIGELFKHLITLNKADNKVLFSKLDDVDELRSRTCNISYAKYEKLQNINFSTERKISISEKSKLDVWLDFKQYIFNEPLTYTFSVPKNYKKQ